MIDIVGHFGSRLSYATIADQLVHALIACDALGSLVNLDDRFLDDALASRPKRERGKKVLLLTDARTWMVEAMIAEYGYENVALFVCPNTDRLSDERAGACGSVGKIYTPSYWCEETIRRSSSLRSDRASIEVMPLGVDSPFANGWCDRKDRHGFALRMLHVTTDTFWPGRKGTEELLKAWSPEMTRRASLTIHCLPQLYGTLHQELGDLSLLDKVKLVSAPHRGSSSEDLCSLMANHDMLVAPSRSEGFGIMPLSALVSGTPVLTTAGTGQDYLTDEYDDGALVLGGWMQIPTLGSREMAGEDGVAPSVRVNQLAHVLAAGCRFYDELVLGVKQNAMAQADWSWWARRAAWAKSLTEWEAA